MVESFTKSTYEGLKSCKITPRFSVEKLDAWLMSQAMDSLISKGKNPLHANLNREMDRIASVVYQEAEKLYWERDCNREIQFISYERPLEHFETGRVAA